MSYAGDANLDPKIQQRILTAFAEAVRLYREGHNEESLTILRSIADVDANFLPAQRLEAAINAGAPVDLAQLLGEMTAASAVDVDSIMARARQAFEQRQYEEVLALAQTVVKDLPGHAEARRLLLESQARMRGSGEIEGHLRRAREALAAGQLDDARSHLRQARTADPSHPEVVALEQELMASAVPPAAATEPEPEFEFEDFAHAGIGGGAEGGEEPIEQEPGVSSSSWDEMPVPTLSEAPAEPAAPASFEPSFGASFAVSDWEGVAKQGNAEPGPDMSEFDLKGPEAAPETGMPMTPTAFPSTPPQTAVPPLGPLAATGAPSVAMPLEPPPVTAAAPGGVGFDALGAVETQGSEFDFEGAGAVPSEHDALFDAGEPAPQFGAFPVPAGQPQGTDARVQELLDQGQEAFDIGDYQGAIETWSRIYLVDAHHPEAEARIDQARRRREEVEREAEHRFYEAREAYDQGRIAEARALCQEVLQLQPQHLEAHDLLLRLETPAAPPPPPAAAVADVEEDLFKDDFVPAAIVTPSSAAQGARGADAAIVERAEKAEAREAARRKGSRLPLPWLLGGIGILVAVLAAIFFLGGKMFSSDSNALAGALRQADQLATEGRLQEAIQVLESMQNQVHGEQLNLLIDRVREYRARLQKRATPVPAFDFTVVRDAIAASQRLKAFRLIQEALVKYPTDLELTRLRNEIAAYSPVYPALLRSLNNKNWESVMRLTEQVTQQHSDDPEARRLWAGAAYN